MNTYEIIIGLFAFFIALPVFFMGAPFLPSYRKKNKINFQNLFEFLKKEGARKFIDLGSGDGRVVMDFARAGFESYGVEINPLLVWWSKLKIRKLGLKNAEIKWGNLWKTGLAKFDIIFIFHFKTANSFLVKKFKRELKGNTIIISTGFPLVGLELIKKEGPFLVYRV